MLETSPTDLRQILSHDLSHDNNNQIGLFWKKQGKLEFEKKLMARRIDLPCFFKSAARWSFEIMSVNGENLQKMTKNFQDFSIANMSANKG